MMYQKLKGIIRDRTLMRILHEEAFNTVYVPREDKIIFNTKKSMFSVEMKDMDHWWIFQILGEVELDESTG